VSLMNVSRKGTSPRVPLHALSQWHTRTARTVAGVWQLDAAAVAGARLLDAAAIVGARLLVAAIVVSARLLDAAAVAGTRLLGTQPTRAHGCSAPPPSRAHSCLGRRRGVHLLVAAAVVVGVRQLDATAISAVTGLPTACKSG
jgi:hypothetical protein